MIAAGGALGGAAAAMLRVPATHLEPRLALMMGTAMGMLAGAAFGVPSRRRLGYGLCCALLGAALGLLAARWLEVSARVGAFAGVLAGLGVGAALHAERDAAEWQPPVDLLDPPGREEVRGGM